METNATNHIVVVFLKRLVPFICWWFEISRDEG